MLLRRLAPLLFVAFPACVDARAPPSDPTPCATEAECTKLYHEALLRLQDCRRGSRAAGYVSPGATPPPECGSMQVEVNGLAAAVARFHEKRSQETGEEGTQGFEVPPLSSGKPP